MRSVCNWQLSFLSTDLDGTSIVYVGVDKQIDAENTGVGMVAGMILLGNVRIHQAMSGNLTTGVFFSTVNGPNKVYRSVATTGLLFGETIDVVSRIVKTSSGDNLVLTFTKQDM